ncbi:hypothetical protein AALO_G00160530 [Alosa alosa]|uniref:Uncharacterized protein n=1 Tax=Alosa alosa TaxID=278164 RepID=A0AAV6GA41_9TELE|nr:hypothetical protein AALO_G00160530 [Alosa alosa]
MSSQMAKSSAQRLSRDLTCSICLEIFKQPVSLPCDHTFCEACISGYWSRPRGHAQGQGQGGGGGCTGSCPQCRKLFPGQTYRRNRIVANIVESYCQGLEESGAALAGGGGGDHRSHTLVGVQEAQQRYRASLNSAMSALQGELNTALECEREAEREVKKLKEHTADLKQRIEAQFSDLHQFLYQEEKLLQVKLKTEERRELIRLDEHKAVLSVEISAPPPPAGLQDIQDKLYSENIKTLLQRQPMKFEKPTHTAPSLCEGRFAGPLQYRVWKSLKGSIYPVPSAITFNSSTANPWLSLTSSLTCVRYQTFNSSVQDNPERFNAALSLLGSQGFTHGRHYWEIEVYSSTVWTVGVARESVPRKGVIKALPANGFWTLSLSYGVQYMAGTSPPTMLSLEEPLARIGVYLDYKRGLVSFYNAESMTHLYTFHETFGETLYPYFNLGFLDKVHENEPLKVFLPKI